MATAVLAEGRLGRPAGKTATGLLLHGQDPVVAAVDSTQAGLDAGEVVSGTPRGIPVVADVDAAMALGATTLAIGISPPGGKLPQEIRGIVKEALEKGMRVVNGLHDFLEDDDEMVAAAQRGGGTIWDVRRPPQQLRVADGRVHDLAVPRLVIMGTDCESGKRITAGQLLGAAQARGLEARFVATGQTGCMMGADAGAVIDRVPADFAAGHVEKMVCDVAEGADLIVVPGQGALHHPAYGGVSLSILQGAAPTAVVLQVVPGRTNHIHFPHPAYEIVPVEQTIAAIENFGRTRVVALAVNGKHVDDVEEACRALEAQTGLPAFDPLHGNVEGLLDVALEACSVVLAPS